MTITRRRPIPRKPEAAPQQEATPSRVRRFRAKPAPAAPVDDRDYYAESITSLQSIAKLEDQIEKLTQQKESHQRHLAFLLEKGELTHVDDGIWQADRKEITTSASTEIDIPKFRKYVGEAKFSTVISITVKDAKSLVAEKEYPRAGITTKPGGGTGEYKTTISRKKKK